MPDIREELERIEDGIRKLKVQYELHFSGAEKLPPLKLHEDLDRLMKKYSNMSFQRTSDRFYFNSVQSRYNAYTELWNKQMRMREEGRLPSGRPAVRSVGPGSREAALAAAVPAARPGRPAAAAGEAAVRIRLDSLEESALRALYGHFSAARSRTGQADSTPAYERFREQVRSQLEALRSKGMAGEVEFRVSVQDNKVSLKARPLR